MPLIKYSQYITYPDGNPAAFRMQEIDLLGGNIAVPLFADKAGTIPLTNPVMTDGDGLAAFYAAPGSFITVLAAEIFHFEVDPAEVDDAWPGVFVHTQLVAASVWTIDHHIGAPPAVTILQGGNVIEGEIDHASAEQTIVTFTTPQTGVALCRR